MFIKINNKKSTKQVFKTPKTPLAPLHLLVVFYALMFEKKNKMLLSLLALGGILLYTGRRAAVANTNIIIGIAGFRIHKVSLLNIECIVKIVFTNSSNQAYTLSKAFFVLKYPKGTLKDSFSNEIASFESLQNLQISARSRAEAEARVNIPTTKFFSVIKEYFTTSNKMLGEVVGTISFQNNTNGLNLPAFEFDIRDTLNSVKNSLKGILNFLNL